MRFLESDLPAVIQYTDSGVVSTVVSMDEVNWSEGFEVLKTNVPIPTEQELEEFLNKVNPGGLPSNHWLKQEVENYLTPVAPLSGDVAKYLTNTTILADAIKRALQWSTIYGSVSQVDPTAIVLNTIHQLTGKPFEGEINSQDMVIRLMKSPEDLIQNRYLIDYVSKEGKDDGFICFAPNARLAIIMFENEVGVGLVITNVSKVQAIHMDGLKEKYIYAVKYRLRHKSQIELRYVSIDSSYAQDAHNTFANKHPDAIVYEVVRVHSNENT